LWERCVQRDGGCRKLEKLAAHAPLGLRQARKARGACAAPTNPRPWRDASKARIGQAPVPPATDLPKPHRSTVAG